MPVFMIGTQRSGSNLLRLMLNQLPTLVAPHPPHILERLMPLRDRYGDWRDDGEFARLVQDVCRLVETNPVPWTGVELDREAIALRCSERSPVAVYGAVHDALAEAHGKPDWLCKSMANVYYLDEIEDHFEHARYIYLYRDGRDVALSFRKAVVGDKHCYHLGRKWHEEQQRALALRARIGATRFFGVAYEALTADPETELRMLCEFLGVAFDAGMLEFHASPEAKRTSRSGEMWANVRNPVMRGNSGKFLRELPEEEIRVFEQVAGESLAALGYERVFHDPVGHKDFSNSEIATFDAINFQLKQEVRAHAPPEDLELRQAQDALLAELRARPVRA